MGNRNVSYLVFPRGKDSDDCVSKIVANEPCTRDAPSYKFWSTHFINDIYQLILDRNGSYNSASNEPQETEIVSVSN